MKNNNKRELLVLGLASVIALLFLSTFTALQVNSATPLSNSDSGNLNSGIQQARTCLIRCRTTTPTSTTSTLSTSTTSSTSTSVTSTTTTSTTTGAISQLAPIPVGPLSPFEAAFDSSNGLVYVTSSNSPYFTNYEGVTAINGTNWTHTFPVCTGTYNGPEYIAYDPANNYLYVSCVYPGNIAVINPDTNQVVTTITVGSSPGVLAYDPANQDVYVSNYDSNTVSVISSSTNKVVATVSTGDGPMWITYDPANNDIYVIDSTTPYGITVVDGVNNVLVTTLQIEASNAIYDPANNDVYATVTGYVSGVQMAYVYAISTSNQVVAKIIVSGIGFPAAESGGSLAYDSANGNVFVGSDPGTTGPNVVSEIQSSTNTVIATANIPSDCSQSGCYDLSYLTYDSANKDIYVSGPGQYMYVVSSSDSLIQTIPLTVITSSVTSNFPIVSIFDPANSEVFVLCSNYAEMVIPLSS